MTTCSHLLLVKCKVHGGASQSFLGDVAPFCNLIGCGEILLCRTKIEYAFHQTFSACDKEAGHETMCVYEIFV